MRRRALCLCLVLAGCVDPTAAVSVKPSSKASSAPVATQPSTEAPPLPVVGGTAALISPGGATAVGPQVGPNAPGISTNPTQTLISNDGGGIKGSSTDGSNKPGGWSAAPSPTPTPAR